MTIVAVLCKKQNYSKPGKISSDFSLFSLEFVRFFHILQQLQRPLNSGCDDIHGNMTMMLLSNNLSYV